MRTRFGVGKIVYGVLGGGGGDAIAGERGRSVISSIPEL